MKSTPPAPTALTLFDASQFEFESDPNAKAPACALSTGALPIRALPTRAPPTSAMVATSRRSRFGSTGLSRSDPRNRDAVRARRQRARARVAKRRYLADSDGFERLLATRRALHLVGD
ncbi:hypothetical protein [Candidatus Poriferisodalis sp.]|uniref:hypothetical protein n=1 Tax=Candidatus Poriferisodalis sp. TaxID=3101277 RepID=UPI003B01ACFF